VTIAIACFNAETTIGRAIASALAQDWTPCEVLVVDDCSADGSVAAVNAAITGSDRLRLVRHERNRGAGEARNTLLANAKGEFVAFFDDDDESRADRISLQLERIIHYEAEHGARHVACFSSGERLYGNGYRKTIDAIGSKPTEPHGEAVADYLLYFRRLPTFFYGAGVPTNALMARRSTFLEIGGFDASLRRVEDVDFAVRLALAGGHFVGIPERVLLQHATEGTEKSPLRNLEAEQVLVDKYRDYLVSKRRYYYARHWPLLRFWHFTGNYPRLALELLGLLLRNPVAVLGHILTTGPARLFHERRMRKTGDAGR
jgi:glycosyltransferase involved in cell wall biosynthesis